MKYKIMKCPFEIETNEFNIIIPLETSEKFNLKDKSNIILQCGARNINASITISSETDLNNDKLMLSKNALEELLLPENIEICVQIIDNGAIIRFGPIIAILTESFVLKDHKNGRPIREDFNCYAEAGSDIGGLLYIFSLNKIDLDNKRILGYLPLIDESMKIKWKEQWLPIPDAVHNRIKIFSSSSLYRKIDEISKLVPAFKVINRTTKIYKWRIQKVLEKDSLAKKYLPKTSLFRGINTLTKMLQEFPIIYLKPVGRSLGLGIIRITKDEPDKYTAKYRRKDVLIAFSGSLEEILTKLRKLMGKRTYIVQEGIPLATYNGNIFDFRVSVQKDGTGTWSFSRWKARVAAQNSIVTNISAGGKGGKVTEIMDSVFKEAAPELMNDIIQASLTICKAIEKKIKDIADIGLDIGITQEGKIYFIEANFREFRLNSGSSEDLENWKSTFKKPVYYLNYLYKNHFEKPNP